MENIGVTLYNLREYCTTQDNLRRTLERVRKIGYRTVQVSGVQLKPEIIADALTEFELFCCATHESMDAYRSGFEATVDKLKLYGCTFTALGSPDRSCFRSGGCADFAAEMEAIGVRFAEHGIRFGFHNHHFEFNRYDGRVFLEEFYERTTSNVYAELDVHWIQRGGGSPTAWIKKLAGRIDVIHLKDFMMDGDGPIFAEVGEGNLDWPSIFDACVEAGVNRYVFEQDDPRKEHDIFRSIEIAFHNMKRMVNR